MLNRAFLFFNYKYNRIWVMTQIYNYPYLLFDYEMVTDSFEILFHERSFVFSEYFSTTAGTIAYYHNLSCCTLTYLPRMYLLSSICNACTCEYVCLCIGIEVNIS